MRVTLLGLGAGTPETLTAEAREALERAELIVGAPRLLESLPETEGKKRAAVRAEEIADILTRAGAAEACAVFSGDTGFHSGAKALMPLLAARGVGCRVLPGISSVQLLAARLGRAWQDWTLCSAHAADCDPIAAVMRGKPAFFLTGGERTPGALCRALTDAGLGETPVTVGENLARPGERVVETNAASCAEAWFAPLSVLLVEAVARPEPSVRGVADEAFARGGVPMTKREVRAAALSLLEVRRDDIVWDIGAGTGSVSVELALAASEGRVYAVERGEEACALLEANRRRFGAWNLAVVRGTAPEALRGLPKPDAVFVGGSKGHMAEIVASAFAANPDARLCVSAIALETLSAALESLTARGLDAEVTQIGVSRTKAAGALHLLTANNPIFLITAKRGEQT